MKNLGSAGMFPAFSQSQKRELRLWDPWDTPKSQRWEFSPPGIPEQPPIHPSPNPKSTLEFSLPEFQALLVIPGSSGIPSRIKPWHSGSPSLDIPTWKSSSRGSSSSASLENSCFSCHLLLAPRGNSLPFHGREAFP